VVNSAGSHFECQERVSKVYRNPAQWAKMSILNVANIGKFSTDRTIWEYADEIR
jgi:starch phosphorylase